MLANVDVVIKYLIRGCGYSVVVMNIKPRDQMNFVTKPVYCEKKVIILTNQNRSNTKYAKKIIVHFLRVV